jgi:glycosyltransferase involved in cell wall biosynthesis
MKIQEMRILQIIDSLEAGGAERMAVNYANALVKQVEFSGLVASRKEGALLQLLDNEVNYLFLNKKRTVDFSALIQIGRFVKKNKITIVQAHSTSFFLAFLLKIICPRVQLIWHDHYGDSEFLNKRPSFILMLVLPFFEGIITVNQKLKLWSQEKFKFSNTIYLPNFPVLGNDVVEKTILKGIDGKRIVCLANLRIQKDHFLLLEVAKKLQFSHPDWSFHLIGKDFNDAYSEQIKKLIIELELEHTVFIYGTKPDIGNILEQCTIGVLTSQSEGLPVALLEYGLYKKPVVVTAVGEIPGVIENGKNGYVVMNPALDLFYDNLVNLIDNEMLKQKFGNELYNTVLENYSEEAVLKQYLFWLQNSHK